VAPYYQIFYTNDIHIIWVERIKWVLVLKIIVHSFKNNCTKCT